MNSKPLYKCRYRNSEPILDTQEKLKDFLKRKYHEREPQLWQVRWQPRDDSTVYIWYKNEVTSVDSCVVDVLREVPPPTRLLDKIRNFFI
jgi:hypothetical protein